MWELKFCILMQMAVQIQKRNSSRTNESHKPHIWAKIRKEIGAHVRCVRMNVSGVAKWQRVPLGSICAFRIHWCSTCRLVETRQSWRGVHSCAVYGGLVFSPTRRLLQPPLEYRRHLVITDSFFSFFLFQPAFFMSDYLHKHIVSSSLFPRRIEFATINSCQQ